ncbi:hypothetical protein [Actinomadura craniellae]|uniref:hypothetical protein n=1 Tax=Actinomadura craniellae TaxID=2231787 RepID=UPI001314C790|nr:hypothetical protein [Actinomadura craniellae]
MSVAAAGLLIGGLILARPVIAAPPQDPIPPVLNEHGYGFGARTEGNPGSRRNGRRPEARKPAPPAGATDRIEPHECRPWAGGWKICTPVRSAERKAAVSPAELAMTKWERLPIPDPVVRTAPPRGTDGLVGLPHWFWVVNWHPLTDRARAGRVWTDVTARPQSMTIDPGTGRRAFRCSGPGTAYDPLRPAVLQRTNCSHTFPRSSAGRPGGAHRVRVTVVWSGTWVGSDGTRGTLPPLTRSTSFPVRVAEAQGLYR